MSLTNTAIITYQAVCPCCGETVEVSYDGFLATSCRVAACTTARATGVASYDVPRSKAPAQVGGELVRHRAGLVAFDLADLAPQTLDGHVAGCLVCRTAVEVHDAATPACGNLYCSRIDLCQVGAGMRDAALDTDA